MAMRLPNPPPRYDQKTTTRVQQTLEQADALNRKLGQNVELSTEALILHAPNGTRWQVTVSNTGTLSAVAL